MSVALFTAFSILGVALVMWVYFDAVERGKAAIPWALSVIFLGWLFAAPLILYVIFRDTGQRPVIPPGGARRQALYVVSFAGLVTLLIGLGVLSTTTIIRAISNEAIGDDDYREALAGSIAAIMIGGVAWAIQWSRADPRLAAVKDEQEFRATFYLHRAYIYTVIGLGCIVVFVTGLWFLGGGLSAAFGSEGVDLQDWLPALGPLAVGLLAIGYHYVFALDSSRYHQALARFDSISPPALAPGEVPPAVSAPAMPAAAGIGPPVAGASYCTNCGAGAALGDAYCARCGTALRTA